MTSILTAPETHEIAAGVKTTQGVKVAEDVKNVETVKAWRVV